MGPVTAFFFRPVRADLSAAFVHFAVVGRDRPVSHQLGEPADRAGAAAGYPAECVPLAIIRGLSHLQLEYPILEHQRRVGGLSALPVPDVVDQPAAKAGAGLGGDWGSGG